MSPRERMIEQTTRFAIELLINRKYSLIEAYNNDLVSYDLYECLLMDIERDLYVLSGVSIDELFN
jgi:hypothetical protein